MYFTKKDTLKMLKIFYLIYLKSHGYNIYDY